jgi:hypothetical protein
MLIGQTPPKTPGVENSTNMAPQKPRETVLRSHLGSGYIYARASTHDGRQTLDTQSESIADTGCVRRYLAYA